MSRLVYLVLAWVVLTTLSGCGDGSVRVCAGNVVFCSGGIVADANAGADQTVVSGDLVTLNGSNSEPSGSIRSYSWAQTDGPVVALTDANRARASFVAPSVTGDTQLTFRLTVVNNANQADSGSTRVTVRAPAAAALSVALDLFEGSLQPAQELPAMVTSGCASATLELAPDVAAVQRGLWLAGRSLAIAKGVDGNDPSAFLDASRVLLAEHPVATPEVAGRIESFGFVLLGALTQERDPALHGAVAARMRGAPTLDDPSALLSGRSEVGDDEGIAIDVVPDPESATARAIERLLASRSRCVGTAEAIDMTWAGLRAIADAHAD